ncbi:hypothetical protein THOG11_10272 [Vibrio harveyi]|nr:hypothetical protein TH15OA1_200080 [Vibrio harveyi]CAH1547702.1 hypothetical protein THOD03_10274 [Vibrio harveyi]CAH1549416.1 hypothetical protein THOG11_10272 [Vibrio harveyi]
MRASPERLGWVMMVMNVHYKITHTYLRLDYVASLTNTLTKLLTFFNL